MKTEVSTYEQQAIDFCESHKIEIKASFIRYDKYFDDDKEPRDIYTISFMGVNRHSFDIQFGQSIANSGEWICKDNNPKFQKVFGKKQNAWDHYQKYKTRTGPLKNPNQKAPTAYDVLACLTKSDPGSFEDFCGEFGCDTDSRKAEKTYNSVIEEWKKVKSFFTPSEIEELQEIQ